jgi:hypothetical protein
MDITTDNLLTSKPVDGINHLQKLSHKKFESTRLILWNLFLITSGSLICAVAITGIAIFNPPGL